MRITSPLTLRRIVGLLLACGLGAAALSPMGARAAEAADLWVGWIEQAGQRWPMAGRVTLAALQPFRIVLEAPLDHAFVLVTAEDAKELAGELTNGTGRLVRLLKGLNVGAEGSDGRGSFLVVNRKGVITRGMPTTQVWDEDPETELHSFSERVPLPGGRMRSVRVVDELCFQPHPRGEDNCVPLGRSGLASATLLMAVLPPVNEMRPQQLRRVELVWR